MGSNAVESTCFSSHTHYCRSWPLQSSFSPCVISSSCAPSRSSQQTSVYGRWGRSLMCQTWLTSNTHTKLALSLYLHPASMDFSMEIRTAQGYVIIPGSLFLCELTIATISHISLRIVNSLCSCWHDGTFLECCSTAFYSFIYSLTYSFKLL